MEKGEIEMDPEVRRSKTKFFVGGKNDQLFLSISTLKNNQRIDFPGGNDAFLFQCAKIFPFQMTLSSFDIFDLRFPRRWSV